MNLTTKDVLAKITELVEAQPDFVYVKSEWRNVPNGNGCFYVEEDGKTGSCLFGQALIALGVPADLLAAWEFNNISIVLRELDIENIDDDYDLFDEVQSAQDDGYAWQDCLRVYTQNVLS